MPTGASRADRTAWTISTERSVNCAGVMTASPLADKLLARCRRRAGGSGGGLRLRGGGFPFSGGGLRLRRGGLPLGRGGALSRSSRGRLSSQSCLDAGEAIVDLVHLL